MFTLIEKLGLLIALRREAAPLLLALGIAEFFFKFKSFTLECAGFLLTWYVLSYAQHILIDKRQG